MMNVILLSAVILNIVVTPFLCNLVIFREKFRSFVTSVSCYLTNQIAFVESAACIPNIVCSTCVCQDILGSIDHSLYQRAKRHLAPKYS
jgi:hypothetical protein